MNELLFSKKYYVRKLQKNDIDQIYGLCSKNHLYYQYRPPYVTRKSIESDMVALPDNVDFKDKYYVGYFIHWILYDGYQYTKELGWKCNSQ